MTRSAEHKGPCRAPPERYQSDWPGCRPTSGSRPPKLRRRGAPVRRSLPKSWFVGASFDCEDPRFAAAAEGVDDERLTLRPLHPWRANGHAGQRDTLYGGTLGQQLLDGYRGDMALDYVTVDHQHMAADKIHG